jgi:ElaB/YqjD/DUF883 family membrane-anchored ribosome-binding protein
MTLSTNEIEHQAEAHRANVSGLIDELRNRVTPGEVIDEFLGWDEGHEIARNFGRQIVNNPLPLALVGAGIAWLMISDGMQNRNGSYASPSRRTAGGTGITDRLGDGIASSGTSVSDAAEYARSAARGAGSTIKDTATHVSDPASSVLEYGRETASSLADTAQSAYAKTKEAVSVASDSVTSTANSAWEKTTQFTQNATDTIKETGSSIGRMTQEQPLLAAGVGFALGMALGAILPVSETENQLLGEQSDAIKQKTSELAGEGYEKAKAVVQRSYEAATDAATDEAQNQGLTQQQNTQSQTPSGAEQSSQSEYGDRSHGGNNGGDYPTGSYPHH